VAYPNRSDLNAPGGGKLDLSAAPNQPYGQAGQQMNAQRAVPMGTPSVAPAAPPAASGPTVPSPGAPLAQPPMTPDQVPSLSAPTARPNEPVTTGLPTGPGAGPEAVPMGPQAPPTNTPSTGRDFLAGLAAQPGAPMAIRNLAAMAQPQS
jgi:hypothetical protein